MNLDAGLFALAIILTLLNVRLLVLHFVHMNKYAIRRLIRKTGFFGEDQKDNDLDRNEGFADIAHRAAHENFVDAVGVVGDPSTGAAATFVFGESICDQVVDWNERARILEQAAVIIINSARKMRQDAKQGAA